MKAITTIGSRVFHFASLERASGHLRFALLPSIVATACAVGCSSTSASREEPSDAVDSAAMTADDGTPIKMTMKGGELVRAQGTGKDGVRHELVRSKYSVVRNREGTNGDEASSRYIVSRTDFLVNGKQELYETTAIDSVAGYYVTHIASRDRGLYCTVSVAGFAKTGKVTVSRVAYVGEKEVSRKVASWDASRASAPLGCDISEDTFPGSTGAMRYFQPLFKAELEWRGLGSRDANPIDGLRRLLASPTHATAGWEESVVAAECAILGALCATTGPVAVWFCRAAVAAACAAIAGAGRGGSPSAAPASASPAPSNSNSSDAGRGKCAGPDGNAPSGDDLDEGCRLDETVMDVQGDHPVVCEEAQ